MKQRVTSIIAVLIALGLAACNLPPVTTSVLPTPVSIIPTVTTQPTSTWMPTAVPSPTPTNTVLPTSTSGPSGQIMFSAFSCADVAPDCEVGEGDFADVYVINSDGTGFSQLVEGGALPQGFSLSPDRQYIAFQDNRADLEQPYYCSHIYVLDIPSKEVWPLMASFPDESSSQPPQWFPDGNRLVCASAAVNNHVSQTELYIAWADGSGRAKITERPPRSHIVNFAISPDGSQIAFIGELYDTRELRLYCLNADGSGLRQLLALPSSSSLTRLVWSPGGNRMLVYLPPDPVEGTAHILSVRADGSGAWELVQVPGCLQHWRWQPDATIELIICERGIGISVWRVNDDGSDLKKLAEVSLGRCQFEKYAWSPNGVNVAFSQYVLGDLESTGLYILDVDSSIERQILSGYMVLDILWLPSTVTAP